jgi:hypothetical protein
MIRVNPQPLPKLKLLTPFGESMGTIENSMELIDVCIQICEQDLEGFSVVNIETEQIYPINSNGEMKEYPFPNTFDMIAQWSKLKLAKTKKI